MPGVTNRLLVAAATLLSVAFPATGRCLTRTLSVATQTAVSDSSGRLRILIEFEGLSELRGQRCFTRSYTWTSLVIHAIRSPMKSKSARCSRLGIHNSPDGQMRPTPRLLSICTHVRHPLSAGEADSLSFFLLS